MYIANLCKVFLFSYIYIYSRKIQKQHQQQQQQQYHWDVLKHYTRVDRLIFAVFDFSRLSFHHLSIQISQHINL